ncbi:hypothetical protein D3C87_552180 [compost metagenome]
MEVFCLEEFKASYETLLKNNSYSNLKNLINTDLINSETPEKHASKISGTLEIPYLKKRLGGSSGYRTYCLYVKVDGKLFLANIYPKTGSKKKNTIGPAEEKRLYNLLLTAIKTEQYFSVKFEKGDIAFEKVKKAILSKS